MTDSPDQPLLQDVRRWLSLAVENLSFGVALAEVGSERVLYANAYARNVWRMIARDEAAAMSYVGFRPDGTRYRPEEWPLRRALRHGETVADEEIAVEFPEGGRGVVVLSAAPIHDDRGTVAGAVVTMYDVSEYRRAETALTLLAEVSEVLTESERDYEVMLRRLTQLVVPRMADWCAIDLWQDGEIRNVGVAHIDPDKVALAHDLQRRLPPDPDSPRGVGNVLRTGRSELMAEIPEELIDAASPDPELQQLLRDLGLHSAIVAPLIAHGEVLGALTLISAEQRRTYTADDVVVAEDLGRRAALSISNARLFREQEEVNHALLESLVPARLPQLEGVDVAAVYQAAGHGSEVGGDFYDLWETSNGSFAVVVGDVQGKGPRAAALTGLARHTIRAGSLHTSSPAAVLEMLNEAILRSDFDRFVTVAYVVVERDAAGLTGVVAVAGHMPVMIRRSGGTVERAGELGSLIGLYPDVTITEQRVSLLSGDTLLLWTDGVTERRRGEEQFGEERLEGILASLAGDDSGTTVRRIADAVRGFTPEPMQDDMAIVAVQVLPAMASEAAA